jgi:hypothetical protein
VKLDKRIKYIISSQADIGDGTEEMDLATGTFTSATPTEEAEDEDDSSLEGDNADEGEEEELEDKVPGEFQAPSVPNEDIDLLLVQRTAYYPTIATDPTVARSPTIATDPPVLRTPPTARTPTLRVIPTSRGSTSARPLVSPYDHRGSNRNNPQHDGFMQMMQMSMLQHNQYMEEEHQRRRKDCLVMQQRLANAVGRAMAALNSYIDNQEE